MLHGNYIVDIWFIGTFLRETNPRPVHYIIRVILFPLWYVRIIYQRY